MAPPRVAILGLHLEVNAYAPLTKRRDFEQLSWAEGEAITEGGRAPVTALPAEIPGFYQRMDATGSWEPVPLIVIAAPPGGMMEPGLFPEFLAIARRRLEEAGPVDAVYVASHGASRSVEEADTDGAVLAMLREVVGPDVPVVGTLDLHCNVSDRQAALADLQIAYRTNAHVDMRERAADAADAIRARLGGMGRPETHFIRLPMVAPSVTLLSSGDLPYAQAIREAARLRESDPDLLEISVTGGFVYSDIPKCGLCVWASAKPGQGAKARAAAEAIAGRLWAERERFRMNLTSIEEAAAEAVATGNDPAKPRMILADVADNPGGGGGGNTSAILAALHAARAKGVVLGVFVDPVLAEEVHAAGEGARIEAVFNRTPSPFADRFTAPAVVRRLSDGKGVGRRGTNAGRSFDLGPAALLELEGSGILVVLGSRRRQWHEPAMAEIMGVDLEAMRCIVVKSRGHFRAGFDQLASDDRIYEVDGPGMVSPVLTRTPFTGLPRPVYPLDAGARWDAGPE
ncbi:M81 family metallopeptidase [Roseomonas xinghualingensis]|uniref:M81 family metallopeptidase n=1 Tax=Roseomonas xinghualingensis TaxID=2986475 RepID=UPI0021F18F95|nr:M81 family metallopeptidase [Roseomonas sp. SXEYE001]MCV4205963.1 M81 family metallopeptidase [Roseomonas sp. SXEYE001]